MANEETDDLVTRLRDYSLPSAVDYPDWHPEICDEAADEIERLRAALAEIAAHDDQFSGAQQARAMRDRARCALGNP